MVSLSSFVYHSKVRDKINKVIVDQILLLISFDIFNKEKNATTTTTTTTTITTTRSWLIKKKENNAATATTAKKIDQNRQSFRLRTLEKKSFFKHRRNGV